IHHEVIQRANDAHPMQRNPTALSHYDHFVVFIFAQIAQRDSLWSIVTCCQSLKRVLYHNGIRGNK
ncbi:MAG: DUF4372 domain-containing protein, partial [Puniceicoccales bacterium]|nr:DUF4372 domain-containing protein [Puniceicoccales bacterium]